MGQLDKSIWDHNYMILRDADSMQMLQYLKRHGIKTYEDLKLEFPQADASLMQLKKLCLIIEHVEVNQFLCAIMYYISLTGELLLDYYEGLQGENNANI